MRAVYLCLLVFLVGGASGFHIQETLSSPDRDAANASLRFLVVGDWGGLPTAPYTTPVETHCARGMAGLAQKKGAQFILALGDNFYYDGVTSVQDTRFQETYESVYTAPSLHVPWYLVAGNHDHRGNVSAEIDYTKISKRWNFPNYYYPISYKVPGSGVSLDIVMLDTVLLCGITEEDRKGDQPHGPEDLMAASDQWDWVEQQLQKSRADYLLVAGHYPVLSVAEHGPTQCLVDRLMPLLYKYRVTAYLSGHDHNLQHLLYAQQNYTMNYFVSGSANFIDPSMAHQGSVPSGSLKYHWADTRGYGGIGLMEIWSSKMVFSFWDPMGSLMYSHAMSPRPKF